MRRCWHCGKLLANHTVFCPRCGRSVEQFKGSDLSIALLLLSFILPPVGLILYVFFSIRGTVEVERIRTWSLFGLFTWSFLYAAAAVYLSWLP